MECNEFKSYHPIVNFIYFVLVIGFSCFFMHPVFLAISLVCGFSYMLMLQGEKKVKTKLFYIILTMVTLAVINPAFNHRGVTILTYFPSGNPLTLESIIYGIFAGVMLASTICWFSCYNEVMTSDKFIYLFAKIIPAFSLVFSMTLRFVPKFSAQLKAVSDAQKCIGRNEKEKRLIKKAKNAFSIFSIMTTWALENSIDTADSMKARGYGNGKRTAFSIYTFEKRDKIALLYMIILATYVVFAKTLGRLDFNFFPYIKMAEASFFQISVFLGYFALCICPVIIEILEVVRWKIIKSKM